MLTGQGSWCVLSDVHTLMDDLERKAARDGTTNLLISR